MDPEDLIRRGLAVLTALDCQNFSQTPKKEQPWRAYEWWHNKYYKHNPPNEGFDVQQPRKGKPEIPYKREIFYPSPFSRFSLGQADPVAYFSCDFVLNCFETIEQFSENPSLSYKELSEYLGGKVNPTPGWHGYPLTFKLLPDAMILDVSSPKTPFFRTIRDRANGTEAEELWKTFNSLGQVDKKATQLVSAWAVRFGFDGIVYSSVRWPGSSFLPKWNLVSFNPAKIKRGRFAKC